MDTDNLLLEQARMAKQRADDQQSLIDRLPELERQAGEKSRRLEVAEKRALAEQLFDDAIKAHQQRDRALEANYNELRRAFRSYVAMLKSDSRSFDSVWATALQLGYYLAVEDEMFGLTYDSQKSHAEELMKNNGIQPVTLPRPIDFVDHLFNVAIEEALKTP